MRDALLLSLTVHDCAQGLTDFHLSSSPMSKYFMPIQVSIGSLFLSPLDEYSGLDRGETSSIPTQSLRGDMNETKSLILGPPIPEKGAPPTIIVTPAEPVSAQDFQIHFFSPTPSRSTFLQPSSRLSKFLSRFPGSGSKPEAKLGGGPTGLGNSRRWPEDKRPIVAYNGWRPYSPVPMSEYGAIRLPEDEDEFDDDDIFVIKRKERRGATKKIRVVLFLMLPILLVLFHLVSAWMSFGFGIGFGAPEMEAYHDHEEILHASLWEWGPGHTFGMDDPRVADPLTGGGVTPDLEATTTALDVESTPTLGSPVEDDSL